MDISKKQVKYVADLARILITEKEIKQFQKEFKEILDYFDALEKIKTKKPEINFRDPDLRKDEVIKFSGNILDAAPEKEGDYIKVKTILKK